MVGLLGRIVWTCLDSQDSLVVVMVGTIFVRRVASVIEDGCVSTIVPGHQHPWLDEFLRSDEQGCCGGQREPLPRDAMGLSNLSFAILGSQESPKNHHFVWMARIWIT